LTQVFQKHGTKGTWYAHASVGTLHVRPILDMRRDGPHKMRAIAEEAQKSWTGIGRIAMIHRLGDLQLGDNAVIVCVSSGHRPEAFEAARFCIDALKASVPIWKKEEWAGGSDWGTRSQDIGKVTSPQIESAQ
jgi:molybdopterin synthase catalytic subunit